MHNNKSFLYFPFLRSVKPNAKCRAYRFPVPDLCEWRACKIWVQANFLFCLDSARKRLKFSYLPTLCFTWTLMEFDCRWDWKLEKAGWTLTTSRRQRIFSWKRAKTPKHCSLCYRKKCSKVCWVRATKIRFVVDKFHFMLRAVCLWLCKNDEIFLELLCGVSAREA